MLIQYQTSRLHASEEQIEDLQDEVVPGIEHHVVGVGRKGQKGIENVRFVEGVDELALKKGVFGLFAGRMGIRRRIFDESKVPEAMEDEVDDLAISFGSFSGNKRQGRKEM